MLFAVLDLGGGGVNLGVRLVELGFRFCKLGGGGERVGDASTEGTSLGSALSAAENACFCSSVRAVPSPVVRMIWPEPRLALGKRWASSSESCWVCVPGMVKVLLSLPWNAV